MFTAIAVAGVDKERLAVVEPILVEPVAGRIVVDKDLAVGFEEDNTVAAAAIALDPVAGSDRRSAASDIVDLAPAAAAQLLSAGVAEVDCCLHSTFYTKSSIQCTSTAGIGSHLHLKFKIMQ
jgi:hypothetical protein